MMMERPDTPINRRDFLRGSSKALAAVGAFAAGCTRREANPEGASQCADTVSSDPDSWWDKKGFFVHEAVDTGRLPRGVIRARVEGTWRELRVVELPDRFVDWSLQQRAARLGRMVRAGGMDPRDVAGSHNACVATYGGPSRDSAVSLNTAYKGMGFTVHAGMLAETTQRIKEEKLRIERDYRSAPFKMMQEKAVFLVRFYQDTPSFDRTKQVSLELFTEPDFHTHTFLNMMANPITSASFLAFPTFEIRAVPQLLHPKNPRLSPHERDLVAYTNAVHDFDHTAGIGSVHVEARPFAQVGMRVQDDDVLQRLPMAELFLPGAGHPRPVAQGLLRCTLPYGGGLVLLTVYAAHAATSPSNLSRLPLATRAFSSSLMRAWVTVLRDTPGATCGRPDP